MKYFTIKELCITHTEIENVPDEISEKNLKILIEKVLDPIRAEMEIPIVVKSGFRNAEVNEAVGGDNNSQHLTGQAADLVCQNNKKLFLSLLDMKFDQLIYEFGDENSPAWVHVSYNEKKNRQQVLRAVKSKGKTKYFTIK